MNKKLLLHGKEYPKKELTIEEIFIFGPAAWEDCCFGETEVKIWLISSAILIPAIFIFCARPDLFKAVVSWLVG